MYHAELGQFLTRDPLPQDGEPDVLYDNNEYGEWLDMMKNLYGYTSSNPVNRVDPSGLKECELTIFAGHHLPRTHPQYNTLDEVGHKLDELEDALEESGPPSCGTYYGGVGCFPTELQERIGMSFPGRGIPGIRPFQGQNDRLVLFRQAPQILAQAVRAAINFAPTVCNKDKCCDQINIIVDCSQDMKNAIAQFGRGDQRVLCDQTPRIGGTFPNRIKCKGK